VIAEAIIARLNARHASKAGFSTAYYDKENLLLAEAPSLAPSEAERAGQIHHIADPHHPDSTAHYVTSVSDGEMSDGALVVRIFDSAPPTTTAPSSREDLMQQVLRRYDAAKTTGHVYYTAPPEGQECLLHATQTLDALLSCHDGAYTYEYEEIAAHQYTYTTGSIRAQALGYLREELTDMHGLVREDKWRPTAKIFDYPDRSESKRARAKAPAKDTTQPKISSLFVVQPAAPVATPLPEPTFDIGDNVRARYVQKGYEVRTDDGDQVQLVDAVIEACLPDGQYKVRYPRIGAGRDTATLSAQDIVGDDDDDPMTSAGPQTEPTPTATTGATAAQGNGTTLPLPDPARGLGP
jgi:hypothetical protein